MRNFCKFIYIYVNIAIVFSIFEIAYLSTFFLFVSIFPVILFFLFKEIKCKSCDVDFNDPRVSGQRIFNPKKIWENRKMFDTCKVCGGVFMD